MQNAWTSFDQLHDFRWQCPVWRDGGVALGGLLWQCLVLLLKLFSIKWRWTLFSTHLLQCSRLYTSHLHFTEVLMRRCGQCRRHVGWLYPPYKRSVTSMWNQPACWKKEALRHHLGTRWCPTFESWGHEHPMAGERLRAFPSCIVIQLVFLPAATGSIKSITKSATHKHWY